jgi:N,N'-diacetylchitobiose non-reducing end deacetylase
VLIPTPDLATAKRLLCVQPHYDDNDIGAGGTIARLRAAGAQVRYLTVTNDELGVTDVSLTSDVLRERLREEQARAGEAVGVHEQRWLDLPDGGEYDYFALRRAVVAEIRDFRPDFVLTCDPWMPYEAHSDHIQTGRAVAEAVLMQRFPRFRTRPEVDASYEPYGITGVGFYFTARPNVYMDIAETREAKHRAIAAYESQLAGDDLKLLHVVLEIKERQWGDGRGFSHGEALRVVSSAHLHVNPDADEMWAAATS